MAKQMTTTLEELASSIKSARVAKSLTQKELGERVGLPQSHISKIETGTVDLKLSSLIEITRALDLEVKLVPRQALPAVESWVRAHDASSETRRAAAVLTEPTQLARRIKQLYPDLTEGSEYQNAIRNISRLQFGEAQRKQLEAALKPTRQIQELIDAQGGTAALVKRLREATGALQTLRNAQAHQQQALSGPRAAYRLDEEGE